MKKLVLLLGAVILGVGIYTLMVYDKQEPLSHSLDSIKKMVAANIKPTENDLPMTIPAKSPNTRKSVLFVRLEVNGELTLNEESDKTSIDELNTRLEGLVKKCTELDVLPEVQLFADPMVDQQKVIDVLNTIRAASIKTVTFVNNEVNSEVDDEGLEPQ